MTGMSINLSVKNDGIVSSSNGTFISVPQIVRTDYHNQGIMSKVVVFTIKTKTFEMMTC
jgi:hypothetical protein